ncbi:MAG: ribosome silencing factor [Desulfococcaceae bacterium]|nr:ribosome silencing factor [Desulfococcaceae bacterium]
MRDTNRSSDMDLIDDVDIYVKAAVGRKASVPVVLDLRGLTSVADVFIICSGRSNRQVSAIAEHIERELKDKKIRPLSVEGMKEGHWVLMDYGHIIIHVFYDPIRSFYNLEGLWADAQRLKTPSMPEAEVSADNYIHEDTEPEDEEDDDA